ncbi:MAG: beta-lactamase family protein [Gemmatimonadaceae bacterium]|nr:beta-lactamase family protein [Gemmatimonadaceae bacterium]
MRARILCLVALVVVSACGASDTTPPTAPASPTPAPADPRTLPVYFPPLSGDAWETVRATAIGWDSTALASALDWAGTQRSTAMVVLWRGRIVAERYWGGWTASRDSVIASAGKSVSAFLVGQLIDQGRVQLDDAASRHLGAGWSRAPLVEAQITVRHLLSMSSGLDESLRAVADPGTRFFYNNPAYYQLFGVIERAGGQALQALSRTLLFDRIGMQSASWRPNIDTGELGYVLSCTARDMARFGLLIAAGGRWNGQPLLRDTTFFRAMLSSSSGSNPAYGYLWWLNGKSSYRLPGPAALPTLSGSLVPSAPSDLVAALGAGDKKIYVSPALELVVVRHGVEADPAGGNPLARSAFDEQLWQRLRTALRY